MKEKATKILCLDMDAFFASVEQASRPGLQNKPIAVTGKGERTVILSASYDARKKGVRTGQTINIAKRICPQLEIVHASNKKYTYVSSKIAEYLKKITPKTMMYSIDEAFMDITDLDYTPQDLAYKIKRWLRENFKITGSIGIAETYILAKMASDIRKPDGYYEIPTGQGIFFIDGLELSDIWGIGRKTVEKLNSLGLHTPADVRDFGKDELKNRFGLFGEGIYLSCCGIDKQYNIRKEEPCKSISHSVTAPKDIYTPAEALTYILQLSEMVSARARNEGYSGKTITLILKDAERQTSSFRKTLPFYTSATHHIYSTVKSLFAIHHAPFMPLRLVGVALNELQHTGAILTNMEDFMSGIDEKMIKLYNVIDEINNKHTDGLIRASALNIDFRRPYVIAPNYNPTLIYE